MATVPQGIMKPRNAMFALEFSAAGPGPADMALSLILSSNIAILRAIAPCGGGVGSLEQHAVKCRKPAGSARLQCAHDLSAVSRRIPSGIFRKPANWWGRAIPRSRSA